MAGARRLRRNTSSRTGCAWHQSQAASDRNSSAIGRYANPDLHERRQIRRKWANRQIRQKSFDACVNVYGGEGGRRTFLAVDLYCGRPVPKTFSVPLLLQNDFDGGARESGRCRVVRGRKPAGAMPTLAVNTFPQRSSHARLVGMADHVAASRYPTPGSLNT